MSSKGLEDLDVESEAEGKGQLRSSIECVTGGITISCHFCRLGHAMQSTNAARMNDWQSPSE